MLKKDFFMKLVHIISSLKRGGAESLLCSLVKELQQHKIEQAVIYFHEGPHVKTLAEQNISTYQICGFFFRYDPIFWFRLLRCIQKLNPDGIHAWLWVANFAVRILKPFLKIPVINAMHNNIDQNGKLRIFLDRYTLQQATAIVAVSSGVKQSLTYFFPAIQEKITIIPNGIDQTELHHQAVKTCQYRKNFSLTEHHFVIGAVGRFVPLKNFPLLLRSFAELQKKYPWARLMILGTGPEEHSLKNLAQELGIADTTTFIVNQAASGFYELFNCFVISSYKEGISIALLEAMSFGLPCISTNPTPTHDVLTHKYDGLIIPCDNQTELVQAISFLLERPQERQRLAHNATKTIQEQFSHQQMTQHYLNLYAHLGIIR
jgi:glycosyltransferase involved in cell wall biosynthesis